eukprot:TRINITY_DN2059_c3_g1_i1.p1 TRINITY_DN2059_c3_g1~~TRINITY_DN2059_c3_g1_i1.p1  ORF type:complete len:647 (+),score=114.74 TRINITY_DN2059_c3_g1_i1:74-2014(+)
MGCCESQQVQQPPPHLQSDVASSVASSSEWGADSGLQRAVAASMQVQVEQWQVRQELGRVVRSNSAPDVLRHRRADEVGEFARAMMAVEHVPGAEVRAVRFQVDEHEIAPQAVAADPQLARQPSFQSDGGNLEGSVEGSALPQGGSREECAICFEDLCSAPIGVFLGGDGHRCCRHYFHFACVTGLEECPLCRCAVDNLVMLPDPRDDIQQWFKYVDTSLDGHLAMKEVEEAFLAQLDIDSTALQKLLEEKWSDWTDGQGSLKYGRVPDLVRWASRALPSRRRGCSPPFRDFGRWYDFWCTKFSEESLSRMQVCASIRRTHKTLKLLKIIEVVTSVCDDFAIEGTITKEELVEGLGERVYHRLLECVSESSGGDAEVLEALSEPPPSPRPPIGWAFGGRVRMIGSDERQGVIRGRGSTPESVLVVWDCGGPPQEVSDPGTQLTPLGFTEVSDWPFNGVRDLSNATGLNRDAALKLLLMLGSVEDAIMMSTSAHYQPDEGAFDPDIVPGRRIRIVPRQDLLQRLVEENQTLFWTGQRLPYAGQEGFVLDVDTDDQTARVEHYDGVALWYPTGAMDRARDPGFDDGDMMAIGDRVEVRAGDEWIAGSISALLHRQRMWRTKPSCLYKVTLDAGREALIHSREMIRPLE